MATVLHIENDLDNTRFVKRALEAHGYHFLWAPSGRQGLELAESCDPDLILLELDLPDMHGRNVVQSLRKNHGRRLFSVPVIALTSNSLRGAALNALAAGCDAYLLKPISVRELWAQVEIALGERITA
jgi:two-component system cell cycle response regulator DivK